jgi:hypothetical protein
MGEPTFWDDAEAAQKINQELADLKSGVDKYKALRAKHEDAETLLEMGLEEDDPSMEDDVKAELEEVAEGLEMKLRQMVADGQLPDVLTFAGNGEPTCHPQFAEIIDDTIRLRNQYCPKAKVSVLSNATMIHRQSVHDALMRVDNNILKLDTVDPIYINKVDRPSGAYDVRAIIEHMKAFGGHIIIQTMFMRGTVNALPLQGESEGGSISVDNTGEAYVSPWLEAVKAIAPQQVMIYTIDRETPDQSLRKATHEELDAIRDRVIAAGIPCTASY